MLFATKKLAHINTIIKENTMLTAQRFIALAFSSLLTFNAVAEQSAYFKDPSLHDNKLVVSSQGDLWLANLDDNQAARRLTSHISIESSPRLSPSGEQIAFVARYTNVPAVHVMSTNGGIAKQVSFEPRTTRLHSWVDEQTLLVSTSSNNGMHSSWVLKTIDINTLQTQTLPLSDANQGALSKNGNTLVFVQHGLQMSSDNANYYKGGAAGELWRYTMGSNKEASLLTGAHDGSASVPMFYEGRVFFISNQNKMANIWSIDLDGKNAKQHTQFDDWAVRGASIHNNKIVFQHGADIKIYNIDNDKIEAVDISLQSDFAGLRTQYVKKPLEYLENATISADGEKAVITARGQIVVADTNETRLVEISTDPTSRHREAMLSHDGEHIYTISDITGEYEIWQFDASGKTASKQLTSNGNTRRTAMWLSPNGEKLIHAEQSGKLWQLDLDSLNNTLILDDLSGTPSDIEFSSDSRYITFAYSQINSERARIYVKDLQTGKGEFATSEKYPSYSPVFSHDMQWLYFLSERSFRPTPASPWGDRNMGVSFEDKTQLYAVALQDDAEFPFVPPTELDDSKSSEDKKTNEDGDNEKKDEESESQPELQLNNLADKLWQVDIPAGNYNGLFATKDNLFVSKGNEIHSLKFEYKAKLEEMTTGVSGISQSSDKKSFLVRKGNRDSAKFYIVPAKPSFPKDASDNQVKLNDWVLTVEPKQEWQQMFKDAWLMHRDGFFDKNLRGVDWASTKQKYLPLVSRVTERSELNDIFKQMMGELNALHSQVRGGDINADENAPQQAILGARFEDTKQGLKIAHIYEFERELLEQAPPLAQPHVNAKAGDIVMSVNGQGVNNQAQLHKALLNKVGQQVLLELMRGNKIVKTVVYPAPSFRDRTYHYQDWLARNMQAVQAKDTDIGYLHLSAMGRNDLASFARDFYAQYKKSGLIIDVRRNNGGNIDSVLIEKLLRRAWSFWQWPNGETMANMQNTFRGHLVVLADQFTYSDGETFTAGIRALDLGTVIGKKTAGAGVWLSGGNNVVDRGIARVAQFPVFAMDGRFITEGEGISPDIEVTNMPVATFNGKDAQLEAAISYLQERIKEAPVQPLKALPFGPVEQSASDIMPD
jgi:tricorn protease